HPQPHNLNKIPIPSLLYLFPTFLPFLFTHHLILLLPLFPLPTLLYFISLLLPIYQSLNILNFIPFIIFILLFSPTF
ncbi:DUF5366 family protein, partial [Bacillus sp. WP8]|uniref:DUF5366 family protein n=1 Tax=Bacillus sp. WP8 TaxID=756828 RepID=UPI001642F44F